MKSSLPSLFRFLLSVFQRQGRPLEALVKNRSFQFLFWLSMTSLLVLGTILLLVRHGAVSNLELALLDMKSVLRTHTLSGPEVTPSKDIVILGADSNTDKYIRLHPESGLSITIPRDRLARIVDYLTNEGAKAIIFDLEFKEKKSADAALAKAIRRHGRVYAADRMDYTLDPFIKDQQQAIAAQWRENPDYFREMFLYQSGVQPYLSSLSEIRTRLMPWKTVGSADAGVEPFFHPFLYIPSAVDRLSESLNFHQAAERLSELASLITLQARPSAPIYSDLLTNAYADLCTDARYVSYYRNNMDFLRLLEQKRLNVEIGRPPPEEAERKMTQCYAFPTVSPIMNALAGIGISSVDYNDDAYIRSVPILYRSYKNHFYTYLGLRPALDLLGVDTVFYEPETLTLDNRRIPLQGGREVLINWRNPALLVRQVMRENGMNPDRDEWLRQELNAVDARQNNPLLGGGHLYRMISIIDVLGRIEGRTLSPDEAGRLYNIPHHSESGPFSFKNKIVIIGNTVTDIHRTSMSNAMFGPEVVAANLDMFLHDRVFIQRPPWQLQALVTLVFAGLIALIVMVFENLSISFSIGVTLILLFLLSNLMAFIYGGFWMDMIIPFYVQGCALAGATLYRYYVHDQEKHHLTNVFSKYVSPQILSEIIKNPEKALDNLKGGKKELTVLFADLQGFTHQFEDADPEVMVSQLNEYFDAMTEIILQYGGTYDKYMGDSVMAFFGAPADIPNHAEMACQAALDMQQRLSRLNEEWERSGSRLLAHGIGISSGEMFVGNFGSKNIKNFTVMGSNVNLGSRLEAYTRVANWPIIISARTWELAAKTIRARNMGKIHVKGFSHDIQIYGLESMAGEVDLPVSAGVTV